MQEWGWNAPPQTSANAFAAWMKRVDAEINRLCGLSSSDIADQCYRDWFEEEISPREAATRALADEGFPFDEE